MKVGTIVTDDVVHWVRASEPIPDRTGIEDRLFRQAQQGDIITGGGRRFVLLAPAGEQKRIESKPGGDWEDPLAMSPVFVTRQRFRMAAISRRGRSSARPRPRARV